MIHVLINACRRYCLPPMLNPLRYCLPPMQNPLRYCLTPMLNPLRYCLPPMQNPYPPRALYPWQLQRRQNWSLLPTLILTVAVYACPSSLRKPLIEQQYLGEAYVKLLPVGFKKLKFGRLDGVSLTFAKETLSRRCLNIHASRSVIEAERRGWVPACAYDECAMAALETRP